MAQAMFTLDNGEMFLVEDEGKVLNIQDYTHSTIENVDHVVAEMAYDDVDQTLDANLAKVDFLRKKAEIIGRDYRRSHRYGHRGNGQRCGFGDGERLNPKRRRWNINRRNAAINEEAMRQNGCPFWGHHMAMMEVRDFLELRSDTLEDQTIQELHFMEKLCRQMAVDL